MESNIKIVINSKRREISESLFESMIEECEEGEFSGIGFGGETFDNADGNDKDEPEEAIEMSTDATLKIENDRVEITYNESELTGMEGSVTTVSFDVNTPELVTMMRGGSVSTVLIFEPNKRHICAYNTPFMPFELCVHTLKVENRIDSDGTLYLDYMIEIRGATAERTKFLMSISADDENMLKENQ